MIKINQALAYPDVSWAFFQMMRNDDCKLMDKLLVERSHPLAYQPGTTWDRFRQLHAAGYRF